MTDPRRAALDAADRIRRSPGYRGLSVSERERLDVDLHRLQRALGGSAPTLAADPYAVPLETPFDLTGPGSSQAPSSGQPAPANPSTGSLPQAPPRPAGTEVIGDRARRTLEAVDFPSFVAGLIDGTFQAIVDSTTKQVREYAQLVASLGQSVQKFSSGNVSRNQARDYLHDRHPSDLKLVLPKPGEAGTPQLVPTRDDGESPVWLATYGLDGQEFTAELIEGPLLDAARLALAEERMQHLATLVLMGINRIVIDDGRISAKMQFHARAREQVNADIQAGGQQISIAQRGGASQANVSTMVSTVGINAQADTSIKADLVGEVSLRFRTQVFDLDAFADGRAIELITAHSRMVRRPDAAPQDRTVPAPDGGAQPEANE